MAANPAIDLDALRRELVPVITVGDAKVVDGEVHLGPHSGLAAQTPLPPH